ncbi:MAG: glycosyltransferase family 4 protein [Bacteroidetes bacterium]|nr:MAG: glycosyltransferase family 4 protein [Bacteroidota bacterium]
MQRICTTLAENGYDITLVGRELPASLPLTAQKFKQRRLKCWFNKGKLFYFEYNLRLLSFLMLKKMDAICAIDLDTIHPCYTISWFKKIPRIYDAHELFTELKEVITRPRVKKIWDAVEKKLVPKFKWGYTVSEGIAEEFKKRYGVDYITIRNVPVLKETETTEITKQFILYQGAVNEGRGLEVLIPAMKYVNSKLMICGDGNFMAQLKKLIAENKLEDKIELKGWVAPDKLRSISQQAAIGIALSEKEGLNQWLALPNKFFDYIHSAVPQITMNFPEYKKINRHYEVAVLIDELKPEAVADTINELLNNEVKRNLLRENCLKAKQELNWQNEEKKLVEFYRKIFAEDR